jgi:hypothetical protein
MCVERAPGSADVLRILLLISRSNMKRALWGVREADEIRFESLRLSFEAQRQWAPGHRHGRETEMGPPYGDAAARSNLPNPLAMTRARPVG